MKKTIKKVLAIVMIGGVMVGLASCRNNNQGSNSISHRGDVCYYGCPNSNRVKKLNTKKRR